MTLTLTRFCSKGVALSVGLNGRRRLCPTLTVYLVANDFGKHGRAWVESTYETTDLETDLLSGQYTNPIRVIAFNTAERWSEDVSEM